MTAPRILVLFAHPSQHRSEVNLPLFHLCQSLQGVTAVDLYQEYPTFDIDVDREQQRLLEHDIIVFLFPLYWYSTPAILKEWQDLVLEYGFAYGHDGSALHGKTFFCAVSAGGPLEAYSQQGFNHATLREILRPLEQTAALTGMRYLPPFALFAARTATQDGRSHQHLQDWQQVLLALQDGSLDLSGADKTATLNDLMALSLPLTGEGLV
ncbi:MAG: potassium transporter KefG [Oceanospirillaceae bacterium]|nr:potassium transporter KefG [Oceanospirillaceae bacterium]|tara:strand:- start:16504 stop:17133 length:630 start_codon:yes stop_codon:yes gene_type:complete